MGELDDTKPSLDGASTDARSQALSTMAVASARLRQADEWRAWLRTASRFHKYSFANTLLIWSQRPDATHVAGYRAWQKLGRQVRKGEHGIMIWAPAGVYAATDSTSRSAAGESSGHTDTAGAQPDGEAARMYRRFKITRVFDVSQTDGDPLPAHPAWPTGGADPEGLLEELAGRYRARGLEVVIDPSIEGMGDARGWYERENKRIVVRSGRTRTLLHEGAHHCDPGLAGSKRDAAELVAESAAYLVGSELGVDMADETTFYLASWGDDTMSGLLACGKRIMATAKVLDELCQPEISEHEEVA